MITIQTQSDGVLFNFQDSTRYLYGDGSILTPYNSLTLIADESNVLTFRKSASNDIFITAGYDELGYSSKEEAINDLKTKLFKPTGGGSESGITSGEVQTMIDESVSGKADTAVVNQAISEASQAILSVSGDVQTISANTKNLAWVNWPENNDKLLDLFDQYTSGNSWNISYKSETNAALSGKADTSAVTAVANDVTALSGAVTNKYDKVSGLTIEYNSDDQMPQVIMELEDEELGSVSNIFNKWGVDASTNDEETGHNTDAYMSNNGSMGVYEQTEGQEGDEDEGTNYEKSIDLYPDRLELIDTTNDGVYTKSETVMITKDAITMNKSVNNEGVDSQLSSIIIDNNSDGEGGIYIELNNADGDTVNITPASVTINGENVLTEADGAYYISFATLATQGITDNDWNGIVAAIDAHRPIYAGYPISDGGIIYYGVECMNKNVGNTEIVMTASDNSAHYFYTFTKNGSNDYTFTSETRPYVTDVEKTAWNAKQDALSAGTGIEISGNVISTTGGSSVTVDPTLNSSSTNPVANSAITAAIDAKADKTGCIGVVQITNQSSSYKSTLNTFNGVGGGGQTKGYFGGINGQPIAVQYSNQATDFQLVEKSAITSAITSASTNDEVAGAKAVYDAIQAGGGGGATYSAGTNISIDTANTINCTLPITADSTTFIAGSPSKTVNSNVLIGSTDLFSTAMTNSVTIGFGAKGGSSTVAIGQGATAGTLSKANDIAIGVNAKAQGGSFIAIGTSTNATGTTKMNLNNQIKVDTNNQVYIKDKTNTTDVCIQDAIAALGGLKFVQCTQAEYDAMVSGGTVDSSTIYFITNVVS